MNDDPKARAREAYEAMMKESRARGARSLSHAEIEEIIEQATREHKQDYEEGN